MSESVEASCARRAIIDIGTVTTRLMVAELTPSGVSQLLKLTTITDLGEGLVESGVLSSEALGRVGDAVDAYLLRMRELGVEVGDEPDGTPRVIAIATSAARDASNSDELGRLLARRGIRSKVISGSREAQLAYAGATCDFSGSNILVSDVGGGSTELIWGDAPGGTTKATITKSHSFDVGCRRVTEMFLASDPPDSSELRDAAVWTRGQLSAFFEDGVEVSRLIGVAGTATSMVSMLDRMIEYDSSRVHGRKVARQELEELLGKLASMTLEQRREVTGLQPGRAAVIVAGLLILGEIMGLARVEELTVSESDSLMGLMVDWPS